MKENSDRGNRTSNIRWFERQVFNAVIEAYENVESVMGSARAIDYAKITGGRGAQFSDNGLGTRLIEFAVDVENTIAKQLTKAELDSWGQQIFDLELKVIPQEVLTLRERLGRAFTVVGLRPQKYFRNYRFTK